MSIATETRIKTGADLASSVRDVTPEEIAFYQEHGWVMLRELVSRETAAELLEGAKAILPAAEQWSGNRALQPLSRAGHEPFRSFAFSRELAKVAHELINRKRLTSIEVPTQFHADSVWCKEPGASGTGFHQDNSIRPGDRPGVFNMWMALDEVTPDMGGLRFLDGMHREGPLGTVRMPAPEGLNAEELKAYNNRGMLNYYDKLTELYEWTEPFHYQPGDATVHHGDMIHGGSENVSNRQRWAYIVEYMPADTEFFFDEDQRLWAGMSQHGLDPEKYPILYP